MTQLSERVQELEQMELAGRMLIHHQAQTIDRLQRALTDIQREAEMAMAGSRSVGTVFADWLIEKIHVALADVGTVPDPAPDGESSAPKPSLGVVNVPFNAAEDLSGGGGLATPQGRSRVINSMFGSWCQTCGGDMQNDHCYCPEMAPDPHPSWVPIKRGGTW